MYRINLLVFVSIFIFSSSFGQKTMGERAGDAIKTNVEGKYLGFRIPVSDDLELLPQLISKTSANASYNASELDEIKKLKMAEKLAHINANTFEEAKDQERKTRGLTPIVGTGYNAIASTGIPSDNSCAVNKSNVLVAMVNSNLRYYNTTNGATLSSNMNLDNFFNTLPNSANTCDPKVIFDQQADRFIVFAQTCDGSSSTSDILFAFSKTSDPASGWHFYSFTGNPNGISTDVWFDYPKIGVSNHDVFVTGNFFNDGMSYEESGIYQIDKTKCYAGQTLASGDAVVWTGITNNPFTMVPMSNGQSGGYGNNMYLVSTGNSWGGNTLNIYEITNAVQSSPQLVAQSVNISNASEPGDGVQNGSTVQLKTGDNRGMDGFYLNGTIHYVFHCDVGGGYSGINYSRLTKSGSNWQISQNKTLKMTNKDVAYPSISSMGYNGTDQGAIIMANFCSTSDYPGMCAVYVDHFFSNGNFVTVKAGTSFVNIGASGGKTRWGDYSSISRVQNATTPTAWCFGTYGNTNNTWTNYFAKITTNDFPVSTENAEPKLEDMKATVYPNPIVEDIFKVNLQLPEGGVLDIKLLNMKGEVVRQVYKTNTNQGEKIFSFNKGALASGQYILNFSLNNKVFQNEKISVIRN